MRPCHRAVANTPPKWFAASVSLRRAMLPSPSSGGFGLLERLFFEATLRSLLLRPDDLLTILKMALSIDSRDSVSLPPTIQATRFCLLPRWDYPPLNPSAFPFLFLFLAMPQLNSPPRLFPCLRFAVHLTVPNAKLGAEWIATPFSQEILILCFTPVYP